MTIPATTAFSGAVCLPDQTDRTCVAGPALWNDVYAAAVADLNGDGVADAVAANNTEPWVELSGPAGYSRVPLGQQGPPPSPPAFAPHPWLADVDGDGVLDVVTTVVAPSSTLADGTHAAGPITAALARGLGHGAFGPLVSEVISTDLDAAVLAVADVDGDRAADLIVGVQQPSGSSTLTPAVRVYRGSATGFASPPVESQLSPSATACFVLSWVWTTATGDFDGDGTTDVAIGGCDGVEVYLSSRGQATFRLASTVDFGLFSHPEAPIGGADGDRLPFDLVAADVDGDGRTDLLSAQGGSRLGFWRGLGGGTFDPVVAWPQLPDQPGQLFVADINGDGLPDVIAPGESVGFGWDSTIEVLLGGGPSGVGEALHVYAPLPTAGPFVKLLAVAAAPRSGGKGTFFLQGQQGELHLVAGACQ
jgi:hypothetical protein